MKMTMLAASILTVALPVKAIVNGEFSDTEVNPHTEVVKLISSGNGFGDCTGTIIAHKWVLTADHCIGGARAAVSDLAMERWGTIDRTYEQTLTSKDEYFNKVHIGVQNGRPQILNGWQEFTIDRAVAFKVLNSNSLVNPERYAHIPLYDQYQNDARNDVVNGTDTNLEVSSYSDVGLVKISEVQHIDSTGYIAELDTVKTSNAEFDGYVLNENNERQDVKVHAFAPVKDTQFLERELQEATGGIHFFYRDGQDNTISGEYYLNERAYLSGSASEVRFDNNNGMPVYAQGGNSGAGVKVKNPRTGSYDIMGVLSQQGGILYSNAPLDPYAITPEMSQIDKYYSEYDPSYIPNDDSWTRLEEYNQIINQYPNGSLPSIVGALKFDGFKQTLLNEVYALNSPKYVPVTASELKEVRVQNLSPETLDMQSILTASGDVQIVSAEYERFGMTCEAVAPLDSCVLTLTSNGGIGYINMAFENSKQPDQSMTINYKEPQGNWLEEYV